MLCFEIPAATEYGFAALPPFLPSVYVDISDYVQPKFYALQAYNGYKMGVYPHPRSIEGVMELNAMRGKAVGTAYAEGFQLVREVVGSE